MDKKQKSNIKKYIALGLTAALVLLLAFMPVIAAGKEEAEGPQASLLSTQASYMDIESQLIGGGTLQSQSAINIKLPVDVKITDYLVGNGDTVKKGDAIAAVDKVSLMTAITEIQETLDYLDDEITAVSTEQSYESITSPIQGTVKQVFAAKGDNVQDLMLQYGALATVSLDGLMAVDLENKGTLKIGDKLTVRIDEKTEEEGRVSALSSDFITITFEDDDYEVNQEVTLLDSDANIVGSGRIYINSQWNVTAYTGKISSINVSAGTSVYVGRTLFTLSEPGHDASYQQLIDQRRDYEELLHELFVMYSSGYVTSPCDGIITGVDENAAFIYEEKGLAASFLSAFTKDESPKASSLVGSQPKGKIILLSNTEGEVPPPDEEPTDPGVTPDPPAPTVSYTMHPAKIIDLTEGSAKVMQTPYAHTVTDLENIPQVSINANDLTEERLHFSPLFTLTEFAIEDTVYIVFDDSGAIVKIVKAQTGGGGGGNFPGGNTGGGGMPSGGGGFTGGMSGGYTPTPVFEPYSLEKNVIASVTSQEQMTLSFTVDEFDISKVYVGQQLTVTVDAIAGEHFEGTVSSIASSGENEGGNSKFSVEAVLTVSSDMLPGMTAHAFITLDTAVNALCIPAAALTLQGGENIVYLGFDEKKDELINPVSVTIGVADADNVQILSGLDEGSSVYYKYYE